MESGPYILSRAVGPRRAGETMVTPSWVKSEKKEPNPKTKFLPGAETMETGHRQTDTPKLQRLGHKMAANIKHWLECRPVEEVCIIRTEDAEIEVRERTGGSCRERLLLTLGVLFVLLIVVLLLLWNYKCTVIDQLCQGNGELLTPLFKEN
ncbi:hypothetical protein XENTR_v10019910 [Xenopus tropicalis]|uniref:Uncharacterized protein LOC116406529 isoform X2 n=1 Tax=Xenopus tropicalis TaxID=8364 RepID=A0A8J1IPQ2_XENTR|nr:uncharacterized protein LOC116406529 isoform X2 [Xenopus tropicalis]KAE8582035.1 hypothetical protein XENTR_v10019910 [Xenopus tropicalis]